MKKILTVLGVVIGLTLAGTASAADFKRQVEARQAHMALNGFNMGILGAMAKGDRPYDAEAASAAANNLLMLSKMNGGAMWPKGSGSDNDELWGKTRAKPEIWTNFPMVAKQLEMLTAGATKLAAEAGNGLDALRANIGAAGSVCSSCHQDFRGPRN